MNVLLIIVAIYFLNKKSNTVNNILSNIDLETTFSILETFGVDPKIKEILSDEDFKNLLNGTFDVKLLLPLIPKIMPLLNLNNKNTFKQQTNEDYNYVAEGISPIKDIVDDDTFNDFDVYFKRKF